jgi:hypothetical protein
MDTSGHACTGVGPGTLDVQYTAVHACTEKYKAAVRSPTMPDTPTEAGRKMLARFFNNEAYMDEGVDRIGALWAERIDAEAHIRAIEAEARAAHIDTLTAAALDVERLTRAIEAVRARDEKDHGDSPLWQYDEDRLAVMIAAEYRREPHDA